MQAFITQCFLMLSVLLSPQIYQNFYRHCFHRQGRETKCPCEFVYTNNVFMKLGYQVS